MKTDPLLPVEVVSCPQGEIIRTLARIDRQGAEAIKQMINSAKDVAVSTDDAVDARVDKRLQEIEIEFRAAANEARTERSGAEVALRALQEEKLSIAERQEILSEREVSLSQGAGQLRSERCKLAAAKKDLQEQRLSLSSEREKNAKLLAELTAALDLGAQAVFELMLENPNSMLGVLADFAATKSSQEAKSYMDQV